MLDQSLEGYQTPWLWEWFHKECKEWNVSPTRIIYVTGNMIADETYEKWAKDNNVLKKPKNVARGASMQIVRSHQEEIEFPSQQKRALEMKSNSRARHASAFVSSGKSLPKDQIFIERSNSSIQITGAQVQNYPGYHT